MLPCSVDSGTTFLLNKLCCASSLNLKSIDKQVMTNRNLKIVKQYITGLCCIVFFFLLEYSNIIPYLLEKTSKLRNNGFVTFIMTGLIKYGLLFYGIIVILSFLLIKEKLLQYDKKKK